MRAVGSTPLTPNPLFPFFLISTFTQDFSLYMRILLRFSSIFYPFPHRFQVHVENDSDCKCTILQQVEMWKSAGRNLENGHDNVENVRESGEKGCNREVRFPPCFPPRGTFSIMGEVRFPSFPSTFPRLPNVFQYVFQSFPMGFPRVFQLFQTFPQFSKGYQDTSLYQKGYPTPPLTEAKIHIIMV